MKGNSYFALSAADFFSGPVFLSYSLFLARPSSFTHINE